MRRWTFGKRRAEQPAGEQRAGYTDQIIQELQRRTVALSADPERTAAAQIAGGLWGRCLAVASVAPAAPITKVLTPSVLYSTGRDLCLVHNGSLSNHNRLRRELERGGAVFETDNDSEVAAAFFTMKLNEGLDLEAALRVAFLARLAASEGAVRRDAHHVAVHDSVYGLSILQNPAPMHDTLLSTAPSSFTGCGSL